MLFLDRNFAIKCGITVNLKHFTFYEEKAGPVATLGKDVIFSLNDICANKIIGGAYVVCIY